MLKKFNGVPNSLPSGSWCNTKEAAAKIGIHHATLQNYRKDGFLEPRTHYIKVSQGKTSPILWNTEQILLRMAEFTAPPAPTATGN